MDNINEILLIYSCFTINIAIFHLQKFVQNKFSSSSSRIKVFIKFPDVFKIYTALCIFYYFNQANGILR